MLPVEAKVGWCLLAGPLVHLVLAFYTRESADPVHQACWPMGERAEMG